MDTTTRQVEVFDTTLRDGLQVEGVSATVDDKLRIAAQLDHLGVHFIEGGWPGANPKDVEFFARAARELNLTTSTMVAFGSTRRPLGKVDDDATLRNLLDAGTSAVCIVAKSWDYHVLEALQTTLGEGEAMIADSVAFLAKAGRMVMVDLEHFFDGYKRNPEFALRAAEAAVVNGASHLVLCDTNGGSLPFEVSAIVAAVKRHVGEDAIVGIHCHDDTGCAVANSVAAVLAGAGHVQGTLNGLGERTGNCNLTTVIPNLQLKLGMSCLPAGRIERLTAVSHHVAEILNRPLNPQAPYVGGSAFAHKAGLHVSAIKRAQDAYEHVDPELVGNGTRFIVSEMAGRATIEIKADELGLPMDGPAVNQVIDDLKRLEHEGYHFEAADASLELLMRRAAGWEQSFFRVESMRVITDELPNGVFTTEATVKVWLPADSADGADSAGDVGRRHVHTAEGNGPVNAIDTALRAALGRTFPQLAHVHLTDYKVRILDGSTATGAVTRVLIDFSNGERSWTTIGVSPNIIEASWRALEEGIVYGLLHAS
ncbi:MAG: citramalate synthase [Actinobacteria bacterium]|nr:citramalate synthase [Actinomycetota bacterium]